MGDWQRELSVTSEKPDSIDFPPQDLSEDERMAAFEQVYEQAREALSKMATEDMVLPEGARRKFLKGAGAAGMAGLAGCVGGTGMAQEDDGDASGGESNASPMVLDWVPKQILKTLRVKIAYNDERIFMRFNWGQPDPGGWIHDMITYDGDAGEWERLIGPSPWVPADPDPNDHLGFYEDRLTFFLDDGSVKGFENFGGWMTIHKGVRTLPDGADADDVAADFHMGEHLGRSDVRKYLPQARDGEWWESDWWETEPDVEDPEDPDQLDQMYEEMLEDGIFLDLAMARMHRSLPVGLCSDHHVLDHRHGDEGTNAHESQDWDEDGPELMFDPDIVDGGAVDINEVYEGNPPPQQDYEQYAMILGENTQDFDPNVAEWDGAAVPRRPLNPREDTEGSAVDWEAPVGVWEDGEWTVEMVRDLDTGHIDTKTLEPGGVYDWAPAIHHGIGQRWHWVSYPLKLGLGTGTDADLHAVEVTGEPDWDELEWNNIPLIYPGQADWTWLVSKQHPGYHLVRNNEMSIWDIHSDPARLAALLIGLEVKGAPRE